MSITNIYRYESPTGGIVEIITSDSTATALAANYILNQAANIAAINNALVSNPFQWYSNDLIILKASDGDSIAVINAAFTSLSAISSSVNAPTSLLKQATFSLTETQVNGMYAAPVQVLAGQGAGTVIMPELITLELIYAAAVTGGAAANIGFQFGNTAHLAGVLATNVEQGSDLTGATNNTQFNFIIANGNSSQWLASSVSNVALYISNSGAAFTGGSGNTYKGNIFYRILPIS